MKEGKGEKRGEMRVEPITLLSRQGLQERRETRIHDRQNFPHPLFTGEKEGSMKKERAKPKN